MNTSSPLFNTSIRSLERLGAKLWTFDS